jgi:hypothetical protein
MVVGCGGAAVGGGAAALTTTVPCMNEWMLQWYWYVPGVVKA